ncbi:MarR family winged helix-turn-helix transcriptional regulator [Rhizobium sp. GN54]|uniref:MarR family winged helix-turn-helix transcriptional regulator n=1 Tax=Rhizobium sp. GN54 TaxID=2898150 RepID=UPI001E4F3A2C|nr:MarR family winged helix-turn-helix transcriptional regulator [Rhizobium sp. GN54]MCD2185089.1 MarR family winged helix-turn-helix transcriptional regulator [Rhizobium sp. GN54]
MDTTLEIGQEELDNASIERSVLFQIKRSQSLLARRFQTRFAAFGVTPGEYGVLLLVATNPGRKQTEIADALGIQRANFVPLINSLERRLLTERRPSPQDKRSNALYLTPAGEEFVEQICQAEARFEAECTARLGGREARDAFLVLLSRLAV